MCDAFKLNGLLEEQEKSRRERKARMVSGADLISALRQQRRELESKCTSASTRLRKIGEETRFLWVGGDCDSSRATAQKEAEKGVM